MELPNEPSLDRFLRYMKLIEWQPYVALVDADALKAGIEEGGVWSGNNYTLAVKLNNGPQVGVLGLPKDVQQQLEFDSLFGQRLK